MRRSVLLLTALLLLAPVASAQLPHHISGQVTDQDGEPVENATVEVYQYGDGIAGVSCDADGDCKEDPEFFDEGPPHQARMQTDAEGRFNLSARDGWLSLNVHKDGYAGFNDGFEVSGDRAVDVDLLRYPDKDAHIQGRILGAAGADHLSISIENPQYGVHACSVMAGQDGSPRPIPIEGDGGIGDSDEADEQAAVAAEAGSTESGSADAAIAPYPYEWRCDITIQEDGSFEGNVTPGYSILRVYASDWERGGPGYYSHVRVLDLAADATTAMELRMQQRPGPDATLKGYVIDGASGEVIPGARISFYNEDAYGWADAEADADGSYQVRIRSGFTGLSVWADGHYPWEGQLRVAPGDDARYDITLTPGQARYGGGCCYMLEGGIAAAGSDGADTMAGGSAAGEASDDQASRGGFQDLGGGLGPYTPPEATSEGDAESTPGFEVLAVGLGVLAVVLLRRRR